MTTQGIVLSLLDEVPKPPDYQMPAGLTEPELARFERRTGLTIPSSVREWLKTVNGALIGPGGTYGIRPRETWLDIESLLGEHVRWMELGWIPVAGDGTGNHYAVATVSSDEPTGVAMFIDTMEVTDRPAYLVGSDMWHLLRGLLSSELGERWWPFDQALTLEADPDLARYTELGLPWKT